MNDKDTGRDFGRVLEDFERQQDVRRGERKKRDPVIRQEPAPDPGPERRYQAPAEEEDFAAALAAFDQEQAATSPTAIASAERVPEPGAIVRGTLLSLDLETAFVDLGAKAEALVRTVDLADEDGVLMYKAGDRLEAEVVGPDPETGALLLRPLGPGGKAKADPRQALKAGDVVDGTVTEVNKGGVQVDLAGRRAFCPISQLDDKYVEDAQAYVGRKLRFEITRYEEGRGRSSNANIVLSRRQLLEAEKKAKAEAVRATLEVGAVVEGTVTAIADYGAFVDLGGLEGLLHVSELSHQRVGHPSELVSQGQVIEVRITKLEKGKDGRDRVSLSRKALERDPWLDAMSKWGVGATTEGKVMRLESFGAFVELQPGIEGLLPIGELGSGRHLNHPREVLEKGQTLTVRVLSLDPERRRISLAPVSEAELIEAEPSVKEALERHKKEGGGFGAMAHFFEKGKKE